MKNSKGFTLVEVIIVVAIIAVLFTLALPSALKFSKNNKSKLSQTRISLIESAATKYGKDNAELLKYSCQYLPTGVDDPSAKCLDVPISILVSYNYLTKNDLINPVTSKNYTGAVEIQYYYNRYSALYHANLSGKDPSEITIDDSISEVYGDDLVGKILVIPRVNSLQKYSKAFENYIYVRSMDGNTIPGTNKFEYCLSTEHNVITCDSWKKYVSGTTFIMGSNLNGTYYMFIREVLDSLGNSSYDSSTNNRFFINNEKYHLYGPYYFDTIAPTIELNLTGTTEYVQTISLTMNATDNIEFSTDNAYKYYLSSSPTDLIGGTWADYDLNEEFYIGSRLNGTYYLFFNTIKDVADNVAGPYSPVEIKGNSYYRFGPYYFDNTRPSLGITPLTRTTPSKELAVTISVSDGLRIGYNEYHYYLSSSKTAITDYNEGVYTPNMLSSLNTKGLTGNYYLIVDRVKDQAGNETSLSDYDQLINGQKYHVFGPYNLDNRAPQVTVTPESKSDFIKSVNLKVSITEENTIDTNYNYYISANKDLLGTRVGTYTNNKEFSFGGGNYSGSYYIHIASIKDNSGNITSLGDHDTTIGGNLYYTYGPYSFDNDEPSVIVAPTKNETPKESLEITISYSDNNKMNSNNKYEYALSTSKTEIANPTWKTYTSNAIINLGSGLNGTYYLFVKKISDTAGNTSGSSGTINNLESYHVFGPYIFDNEKPTVTVDTISHKDAVKNLKVKINATDSVALADNTSRNYILISKKVYADVVSDTDTEVQPTNWSTYTNNSEITIGDGLTGEYYLVVKGVKDKANHLSEDNSALLGNIYLYFTVHIFGPYNFDNTPPTVTSFSINNDAVSTDTTTVSLNSNVSGATKMCFTNNVSSGCSNWINYYNTYSWTIPTDKTTTVYAWYKDSLGNQSGPISDSIDYVPHIYPTGTINITVDKTTSTSVYVEFTYNDAEFMCVSFSGSCTIPVSLTPNGTYNIKGIENADNTLFVTFISSTGDIRTYYDTVYYTKPDLSSSSE